LIGNLEDLKLPRVSVIIVNYNGYCWLKLFVDSLINTVYPDFEIIIVDNASTDQSVQYLKEKSGNIKVVELTENRGFAAGANRGAKEATGKIFAFVNNDMEVRPDWLINAVNELLSDETAAAVQCKILTYSNRQKIDSIGLSVDRFNIAFMIGRHEIDRGQYDSLKEIGACSGGAMVIWKHIFDEVGSFDPEYFMYYEDVDLSWRIRLKGLRIFPAQSSVVYHVGSATSKISNKSLTPFFAFHTTKNYIYCWLKNSSAKVIFIYGPVVISLTLAKISFELLSGRASVALAQTRGIFWNIVHLRLIARERIKVRKLRKIDSENILLATEIHCCSHVLTWIRSGFRMKYIRQT
jgi:GT2 family glycosyltransferase